MIADTTFKLREKATTPGVTDGGWTFIIFGPVLSDLHHIWQASIEDHPYSLQIISFNHMTKITTGSKFKTAAAAPYSISFSLYFGWAIKFLHQFCIRIED